MSWQCVFLSVIYLQLQLHTYMYSKLVASNKYIGITHMHYNIWIQCHKICLCYDDNGNYNCSRNTIGPVYPGQTL